MNAPINITIQHKALDWDSAKAEIEAKAEKMEQYFNRITYCDVTVSGSQQDHQSDKQYNVLIKCGLPGDTLVINHNEGSDFSIAVHEAFKDLYRQLETRKEKMRHQETHAHPCIEGHILRLIPHESYGFIAAADGAEYYFHADHLKNGHFKDLEIGQRVHFIEVETPSGMQAHRVHVLAGAAEA